MSEDLIQKFWEDRLQDNFDLSGVGFLALGLHYNIWMYKLRSKTFLNKIRSLQVDFKKSSVLDVGCGTGFYIDLWKSLGSKVVGLDFTNTSIQKMKKKYPRDEFHQIDIGSDEINGLNNKNFDIISAFDVLFHIVDDKRYSKTLQNISSLLKAGGMFIFTENFLHGKTTRSPYQVCRSLHDIEKILEQNGFEIIDRSPVFFLMNAPIDSNKSIFKINWKLISKLARHSNIAGFLTGAILYPLESFLVSVIKEGPTTEMMICRKVE